MSHPKSKKKQMLQQANAAANEQKLGKVANDHNKPGASNSQKNESRRTPESRSDRESMIGNNQSQSRQSGPH